jgi:hypothetical protein
MYLPLSQVPASRRSHPRGRACYRLAVEAAAVTKPTIVGRLKDPPSGLTVESMPGSAEPHYDISYRAGGWVSVLVATPYRLSAEALGQIILRPCIRNAADDRLTVSMSSMSVLTLAGIAPRCVVPPRRDIRGILDGAGSLSA